MIPPFLSPDIRPSLSSSAPLTGERHSAFIIHLYFHFFKQFNRYSEKERCKKRTGVCACPEIIGSSRNLGGRAAWGRVCGRAKLGAGTLRCLHLCWRLPWDWSDAEQLGRCPKPHKGRCPLTLQGADEKGRSPPLDPFSRLSWSRFHAPSACSFLVLRLSPCFSSQLSVNNQKICVQRAAELCGVAYTRSAFRPSRPAVIRRERDLFHLLFP